MRSTLRCTMPMSWNCIFPIICAYLQIYGLSGLILPFLVIHQLCEKLLKVIKLTFWLSHRVRESGLSSKLMWEVMICGALSLVYSNLAWNSICQSSFRERVHADESSGHWCFAKKWWHVLSISFLDREPWFGTTNFDLLGGVVDTVYVCLKRPS